MHGSGSLGGDLDDGQIGPRIVRYQGRGMRLSAGQRDLDFLDSFDHVMIGDDVAPLVDHDARAHAVDVLRSVAAAGAVVAWG